MTTENLCRQYKIRPSAALRNRIVMTAHPHAKHLASKMARRFSQGRSCIDADDLTNVAMMAAMRALERFEPSRGIKFLSYAAYRMDNALKDHLRECDWVPRLERERAAAGLLPEPAKMVSIDSPPRGESSPHVHEATMPDAAITARDTVRDMLRQLDRNKRTIVQLYHLEELTMREIGKVLGVSESRISQLHMEAMAELRAVLTTEGRSAESWLQGN